jgi:hypothetical protein
LDPVKASDVTNAVSLCNWAHAAYGVPPPTQKDFAILNKKAKELFASVPGTDWQTIVQIIKWCSQNKKRYARIWSYVGAYRHAWAAHALDLPDAEGLQERVARAIAIETDPGWRARLQRAAGEYREEVLNEWEAHRKN